MNCQANWTSEEIIRVLCKIIVSYSKEFRVVETLEQEYGNSSRLQDENQQNPHYNHIDELK